MPFKDRTGKELTTDEVIKKLLARVYAIAEELSIYILHMAGHIPSHIIRCFFYRTAGMKIGQGSTIHMGARFYEPSNVHIGDDSIIGEGVVLDGRDSLTIGNHVDIATDVMIYNSSHDINSVNFDPVTAPVVIEDYVFIGPRAIILPGVTIGQGAIVAAAAVVTKNVVPYSVVAGVPAKVIAERQNRNLQYKLGRPRLFR